MCRTSLGWLLLMTAIGIAAAGDEGVESAGRSVASRARGAEHRTSSPSQGEASYRLSIYVRPSSALVGVDCKKKDASFATGLLSSVARVMGAAAAGELAGSAIDKGREVSRSSADSRDEEDLAAKTADTRPVQKALERMRACLGELGGPSVQDLGTRRAYPLAPPGRYEAPDDVLSDRDALKRWMAGAGLPDFRELKAQEGGRILDVEVGCRLVKFKGSKLVPTVEVRANLIRPDRDKVVSTFKTHFGKLDHRVSGTAGMRLPETAAMSAEARRAEADAGHRGFDGKTRDDARSRAKALNRRIEELLDAYGESDTHTVEEFSRDGGEALTAGFLSFVDAAAGEVVDWLRTQAVIESVPAQERVSLAGGER